MSPTRLLVQLAPFCAQPLGTDPVLRRWAAAFVWVALSGLLCIDKVTAQVPPIGATRSLASEIRLGDEVVAFPVGTVNVPIYVRSWGKADGVRVSIDFDPGLLGYAWYQTAGPRWRVERVSPYGPSRVAFVLRVNEDVPPPPAGKEEVALFAVFYLQSGIAAGTEFSARSPLSLGAVDSGLGLDSYFFTRGTDGADRPLRTSVHDGSVSIYYRDGVEVAGGALTQRPQEFRLPVYLTSIGQANRPQAEGRELVIGVDYDEIFLGLVDVQLLSPPATLESPQVLDDPASGRARFRLALDSGVESVFARLHVADLVLYYYGAAPPHALLEVNCKILTSEESHDEPAAGVDEEGGAGADTPRAPAAVIDFLPPYFVRGNVDSSVVPNRHGGLVVEGDLLDARMILESIFLGRARPACEDAADVSDDGKIGIEDAIHLLNHLFRGGAPPLAPFPLPGPDPSAGLAAGAADSDGLGCNQPLPYFAPISSR